MSGLTRGLGVGVVSVVCARCKRRGSRGFVRASNEGWVCSDTKACFARYESRQGAA
jgi:hypothetical protein